MKTGHINKNWLYTTFYQIFIAEFSVDLHIENSDPHGVELFVRPRKKGNTVIESSLFFVPFVTFGCTGHFVGNGHYNGFGHF